MSKQYDFSDFDEQAKPKAYDFSDFENSDKYNPLETIGAKLQAGTALGSSDEIKGFNEALGQALGLKGLGDPSLASKKPTGNWLQDAARIEGMPEVMQQPSNASFSDTYKATRDAERAKLAQMSKESPWLSGASEMVGGIIPGMLTSGIGSAAGLGAASGFGTSNAESMPELAADTAKGAAIAGGLQAVGEKIISPVSKNIADYLLKKRNQLSTMATGASGAQAAKFADDAGQRLFEEGHIGWTSTPDSIAKSVGAAQEAAGDKISSSLAKLDAQGASASVDDIVSALESKIAALKETSGNDQVIKQLQKEVDRLYNAGRSNMPLSLAEESKRNFQNQLNYNSKAFEEKGANFAADAFRQEVEKKALASSPELAQQFKQGKEAYGLYAPIKEAAEKRAAQQSYSPMAGLTDMVAAGVGGSIGGIPGAIAGVAAKNVIGPRLPAIAAMTADNLSKALRANPASFGKFGQPLAEAASRGQAALSAAHFLLQRNQEYREMMRNREDGQ